MTQHRRRLVKKRPPPVFVEWFDESFAEEIGLRRTIFQAQNCTERTISVVVLCCAITTIVIGPALLGSSQKWQMNRYVDDRRTFIALLD